MTVCQPVNSRLLNTEKVFSAPDQRFWPTIESQSVSKALFLGLLLFFVFEYVRPGTYVPALTAARLNTLIPVAVFLLTFASRGGRPLSTILSTPNTRLLLVFILLFPIQVFTADVTLYVYNTFKAVVGYFLIYFVILKQVTTFARIRAVFATMVLVHVLIVLLNPNLVLAPEGRNYIQGVTFLGDGNDFAWSACIVLPLALFLAQTSRKKLPKLLSWGSFLLLVLSVIGTQSRGGTLAMAAAGFYLLLRAKKKLLALFGIGTIVLLVFLFAPEAYFERMHTLKEYKTEGSAQGRILAWKSAVRMALDHPLIGVGAGHFGVKYGVEYRPPGVGRTDLPWSNAHSIYFVALGEFGFTGALLLLGMILSNLIRNELHVAERMRGSSPQADQDRRLIGTIQASLLAFSVGGAFLSGLYYPHLYLMLALSTTSAFLTEQKT